MATESKSSLIEQLIESNNNNSSQSTGSINSNNNNNNINIELEASLRNLSINDTNLSSSSPALLSSFENIDSSNIALTNANATFEGLQSSSAIEALAKQQAQTSLSGVLVNERGEPLTEKQKEAITEFRTKLESGEPLSAKEIAFTNDACLCRYLRSRDWHLGKAHALLLGTLIWRREFHPDEIDKNELIEEAASGKMYINSFDRFNRPVIYMKPRYDTTKDIDKKFKHLIHTLETATRLAETKGAEQMTWILDFSGASSMAGGKGSSMKDEIKLALQCLHAVQDHYPERLGNALVLFPPFMFSLMWKVISPFINQVTAKKIIFINDKKKLNQLLNFFDPEQLEVEYGGTNTFQFQFNLENWLNSNEL
eukprot:TRINITY_DN1_c3_g1_i1.p1 TRINITY_DN1_c3_g1~~TRINITY_DN1_c3_g1_i1.p1  ORF type:complete len:368 (+),score=167.60 TRINITY_DN1_c3_g1_i1:127-1230(+)